MITRPPVSTAAANLPSRPPPAQAPGRAVPIELVQTGQWTRKLATLWLVGWVIFSLPLADLRMRPRFRHVNLAPFQGLRRLDAVRNLTYYVPAGVIGLELGLMVGPTVAIAATLSAVAEVSQTFSSNRVPSTTDIIMNTTGAAIGALYWHARRRRRQDQVRRPSAVG